MQIKIKYTDISSLKPYNKRRLKAQMAIIFNKKVPVNDNLIKAISMVKLSTNKEVRIRKTLINKLTINEIWVVLVRNRERNIEKIKEFVSGVVKILELYGLHENINNVMIPLSYMKYKKMYDETNGVCIKYYNF